MAPSHALVAPLLLPLLLLLSSATPCTTNDPTTLVKHLSPNNTTSFSGTLNPARTALASSHTAGLHLSDLVERPARRLQEGSVHTSAVSQEAPGSRVQGCINKNFSLEAATWDDGLERHSRLWLERVWEPSGPSNTLDITVYTTLTMSRLGQLEQQCLSWPGPLSAAVYIPVTLKAPPGGSRQRRSGRGVKGQEASQQQSGVVHSGQSGPTLKLPTHARAAVADAVNRINSYVKRVSSQPQGGCALTLALYWELFTEPAVAAFMFPINTLRNYAALMARTDLIAMVDVDLLLSQGFVDSLVKQPSRVAAMKAEALLNHSMLIMPPFEAFPCQLSGKGLGAGGGAGGSAGKQQEGGQGGEGEPEVVDGKRSGILAARGKGGALPQTASKTLGGKSDLWDLYRGNCVTIFHCARGTHWYHNYSHWFLQRSETTGTSADAVSAYEIPYGFLYEPWFIGHRALVPFYDVRFKGFGYNKQLQILQLVQQRKYRLMLLSDAWLVHLPHSYSTGARAFHSMRRKGVGSRTIGKAKVSASAAGVLATAGVGSGTGQRGGAAARALLETATGETTHGPDATSEAEARKWVGRGDGSHRTSHERSDSLGSGELFGSFAEEAAPRPGSPSWHSQARDGNAVGRVHVQGSDAARRLLQGRKGGADRKQRSGTLAEQFKSHIESMFWRTQKSMGRSWEPELDPATRSCLQELPWWSGYTEQAARERLASEAGHEAAAVDRRPPKPLPQISHDYFVGTLRPQLYKCPKVSD